MDHIILDLGSNVNVLPKQILEMMGRLRLTRSLCSTKIGQTTPMGRLASRNVDIDGVCNVVHFEVIEIVDDKNPYLALLGLDWEFYNQSIIILKKI